jgi:mannose-1-phosphate guanylyltransferase
MDLHYLEDRMPRGPAGCVRDVASCQDADLFVVAEGGVLPLISLPAILEAHRHAEAALTVVVGRRPLSRGMVDEPGGIYVFSREALDQVPPRGYQDIKEMLIPRLHAMGARISCYEIAGRLVPRVKGAASYLAVNTWMLERTINETRRWQDYKFQGEARIHRSAELGEGVELIGPVLLGAGSRVGRATMIIGPTTVGMQCVIGRDAVVSRSAMWDGSRVGDRSVVDHSILTHRAVVASGTHISEGIGVMPPTRREAMRGAASDILRESEKDAPRVPPVTASRRQGSNGKKQCEQRSPSLQQGWTSKAYS